MGHRDRWRTAALIAAAAGLVVQPVVAVPFVAATWALSTRRRAPLAMGPALASAVAVGVVAVATSPSPAGWLLAIGVLALVPLMGLWSSVAGARDGEAVAVGFAIGMVAHVAFAWGSGQTLPSMGMTAHANVLGALGALTLPVLAATALQRGYVGWVARFGVLAALAAVATSGSRGALAALLVAVAWGVVRGVRTARRSGARSWAGAGAVLALVALFGTLAAAWLWVRQPTLWEAVGTTGRTTLWGVAAEGIVARPVFGHGALAWARVAPAIEPSVDAARFPHAHSGYLEVALSFGLVGLSVVLAYFVAIYRAFGAASVWSAAARATLLAFAIANVGDAFVVDARFLGIVVLVSGAVWAKGDPPLSPPAPTPRPPTA